MTTIVMGAVLTLLASASVLAEDGADKNKQKKPNIIAILSDDLNWHHPGFNGGPATHSHS